MSLLNTRYQHLVLTVAGAMPTVPTPSTLTADDPGWVAGSDIHIGEIAVNKADGKVYYRDSSGIRKFPFTLAEILAWGARVGDQKLFSDNDQSYLYLHNYGWDLRFLNGAGDAGARIYGAPAVMVMRAFDDTTGHFSEDSMTVGTARTFRDSVGFDFGGPVLQWTTDGGGFGEGWIYGDASGMFLGHGSQSVNIDPDEILLEHDTQVQLKGANGRLFANATTAYISTSLGGFFATDLALSGFRYIKVATSEMRLKHNTIIRIDAPETDFASFNRIRNLPNAVNPDEPLTKGQFDTYVSSVGGNRGPLDCSADPDYPASSFGDRWEVTGQGKVGGASGIDVDIYDEIVCSNPAGSAGGDQATAGADFYIVQGNIQRATEGTGGYIRLATSPETIAEVDNEKAVTPLKLGQCREP